MMLKAITDQEYRTLEVMQQQGGSFVKALAMAFYMADAINFETLKKAFPAYWQEYSHRAEQQQKTHDRNF